MPIGIQLEHAQNDFRTWGNVMVIWALKTVTACAVSQTPAVVDQMKQWDKLFFPHQIECKRLHFHRETNLDKYTPTYQFSYFLSLFTMPCSSICLRMTRFSSSEPSQMCKKSGWHRLTLVSTKSLTAGLRVLRSPCRTLTLLWFWDWSWGGMVASVRRSEWKVQREETRRASQRGWLSWRRGEDGPHREKWRITVVPKGSPTALRCLPPLTRRNTLQEGEILPWVASLKERNLQSGLISWLCFQESSGRFLPLVKAMSSGVTDCSLYTRCHVGGGGGYEREGETLRAGGSTMDLFAATCCRTSKKHRVTRSVFIIKPASGT